MFGTQGTEDSFGQFLYLEVFPLDAPSIARASELLGLSEELLQTAQTPSVSASQVHRSAAALRKQIRTHLLAILNVEFYPWVEENTISMLHQGEAFCLRAELDRAFPALKDSVSDNLRRCLFRSLDRCSNHLSAAIEAYLDRFPNPDDDPDSPSGLMKQQMANVEAFREDCLSKFPPKPGPWRLSRELKGLDLRVLTCPDEIWLADEADCRTEHNAISSCKRLLELHRLCKSWVLGGIVRPNDVENDGFYELLIYALKYGYARKREGNGYLPRPFDPGLPTPWHLERQGPCRVRSPRTVTGQSCIQASSSSVDRCADPTESLQTLTSEILSRLLRATTTIVRPKAGMAVADHGNCHCYDQWRRTRRAMNKTSPAVSPSESSWLLTDTARNRTRTLSLCKYAELGLRGTRRTLRRFDAKLAYRWLRPRSEDHLDSTINAKYGSANKREENGYLLAFSYAVPPMPLHFERQGGCRVRRPKTITGQIWSQPGSSPVDRYANLAESLQTVISEMLSSIARVNIAMPQVKWSIAGGAHGTGDRHDEWRRNGQVMSNTSRTVSPSESRWLFTDTARNRTRASTGCEGAEFGSSRTRRTLRVSDARFAYRWLRPTAEYGLESAVTAADPVTEFCEN